MLYRRNKRVLYITLFALFLVSISVGYAYITSTLKINGTTKISKNTWDVHFEDITMMKNTISAAKPTLTSNDTIISFTANLKIPTDEYSFMVYVVNDGSIDAMVSDVVKSGITTNQEKYTEFSVTYSDGQEIKEKDKLGAGERLPIKVKVRYKDDITAADLPSSDQNLSLSVTITYVQADSSANKVEIGLPVMKSYVNGYNDGAPNLVYSDYHSAKYVSKITKIVTKDNISIPDTAIEYWDVSEAGDGSVIAYIENDGSGNGTYQVTIGGIGGISANPDSTGLFSIANQETMESSLTSIDLTYLDTSKVTSMMGMFVNCISLTELDVSNFDTSKVTNMEAMFLRCSSLTELDVSNFDTSKVTNMRQMFYGCSSLTELDLSNFDTSKVTNMIQMFSECSNLTELNISNFNTSRVTDMSYMFDWCSSLTELDLSKFDTSKVTNMRQMFAGCISLTKLDFRNLTFNNDVYYDNLYLEDCINLTTLNLQNVVFEDGASSLWEEFLRSLNDVTGVIVKNCDVREQIYGYVPSHNITSADGTECPVIEV